MTKRQGPLSSLRAVEFACLGLGPFCGMQLADLGADVVLIDRPCGATRHYGFDPRRNLMNRGRRAIELGLKTSKGQEPALFEPEACVVPVLSSAELTMDPHLRVRDSYAAEQALLQAAPAPRFSRTSAGMRSPPPQPNEHRDEILSRRGIKEQRQ